MTDVVQLRNGGPYLDLADVVAENARLEARIEALEELATTDPLTGLLNRRGAEAAFVRMTHRHTRKGGDVSAVLIDLDHFKLLNDAHGHEVGDVTLRLVGEQIRGTLRATDAGIRWGGEELLILTEAHIGEAARLAERLRLALLRKVKPKGVEQVTASFGVAWWDNTIESLEDLVKLADGALYHAKAAGRNCVRLPGGA